MKTFFFIIYLSIAAFSTTAQDIFEPVVRKAPDRYPPAALAVRASGEVGVVIEIDRHGKVASATAFSGHPLLRAVSVVAAKQWEFPKIAKGEQNRTVNLFFSFSVGGPKQIESSEKREETVLASVFQSTFSANLSQDTLIPRLLLLPRKNDSIQPKYCNLHESRMSYEILPITCSRYETVISDEKEEEPSFSERHSEAELKLFPYANAEHYSSCGDVAIEEAETLFCASCRISRDQWLRDNK